MKLNIVDYIGEPSCLVGEPTHSKNAGQIGSFLPGFRLKINNVWVATASMGWCPHFFGQFGHVLSRLWVTVFVFWKPGHLFHQLGKICNPGGLQKAFPQWSYFKITQTIHQTSSFVFHSLLPWTWVQHQATELPPLFQPKTVAISTTGVAGLNIDHHMGVIQAARKSSALCNWKPGGSWWRD